MAQPKPIVQNLFRFVTLRTPQLINPQKKEYGFIYHPNPEKSHFLSQVDKKDLQKSRSIVREYLSTFDHASSYNDIRDKNKDLYDFGLWLLRNRKKLSSKELVKKAQNFSVLNEQQRINVWDNLFAQIIKKNNPSLRQACNTILISDNFVAMVKDKSRISMGIELYDADKNGLTDEEKVAKIVKRIASAKIIVPKAFSVSKNKWETSSSGTKKVQPKQLDLDHLETLRKHNNVARLKQNNKDLIEVQRNIKSVAFKGLAENGDIISKDIISKTKLEESSESNIGINHLKKSENINRKLKTVYSELNGDIIDNNRLYRESSNELSRVSGRRRRVRTSNVDIQNYCFIINLDVSKKEGYIFILSIKLPAQNISISALSINLKANSKTIISSNNYQEVDSRNQIKSFLLFSDEVINLEKLDSFSLQGSVTFNNGKQIDVDNTMSLKDHNTFGCPESNQNPTFDYDFEENVPLYGVSRVGMGVFRRVEQEVCCYVPGEVSRIENIMAREYKERHTRSLTSTEDIEEESSDYEVENQTDTATTIRNEIQTEVAKVLDKNNNIGTGADVGVSGKYPGGLEVSANGYLDFAMANASSESDSEAKNYAEEITNTAVERILQRTSQKRTSKIIKEFEENNRHGYDNREGDKHVTGVYRWIDIIYTNRLVNYGNRLMVEFLIPEPARLYKDSILPRNETVQSKEEDEENGNGAPIHFSSFGINSASDIEGYNNDSDQYYQVLQDEYGVSIPQPPESTYSDSVSFVESGLPKTKPFSKKGNITIPTDFRCKKAFITGWFRHDARNKEGTNWVIEVGGAFWRKSIQTKGNNDRTYTINTYHNPVPPSIYGTSTDGFELNFNNFQSQVIDIAISGDRTLAYSINIELIGEPIPDVYYNWQEDAFKIIESAYNNALKQYEDSIEEEEAENIEAMANLDGGNPTINRSIEERELKRSAIEMLTEPFFDSNDPFKNRVGADFYKYDHCEQTIPSIKQNLNWEKYASHVKFFEQAFDWKLIAYLFYPYYWASKCDWYDLMNIRDVQDAIFKGFLQSGMARMVVPVRKGFEEAVNYYFETGDIWNGGGLVLDTDDDLYLSIDEELQEPEGFVDEEWQTRVPTTLTIIQGDSVFLEDEGLPCCDKMDQQGADTLLRGSSNILGNIINKEEN
tara:strand:+ start:486 stop:3941 length:3456 start_codon:yes stop_codon:yes gene_type:complete